MANTKRKHFQTLTHQQLVALATQKEVLSYQDALILTKGQLIAIMVDIEGVLTPTKTWVPVDDDAILDNDQRVIVDLVGAPLVTIEVPSAVPASRV